MYVTLRYVTSCTQTHLTFSAHHNEVFVAIRMEINVKFRNDVAKASVCVCGTLSRLFKRKLRIQYLGSSPPRKKKHIYYIFMIITLVRKYRLFDIQDVCHICVPSRPFTVYSTLKRNLTLSIIQMRYSYLDEA